MKNLQSCAGISNLATSTVTASLIGKNFTLCSKSSTAMCLAKSAYSISTWPIPRETATSDSKSSSFGGRASDSDSAPLSKPPVAVSGGSFDSEDRGSLSFGVSRWVGLVDAHDGQRYNCTQQVSDPSHTASSFQIAYLCSIVRPVSCGPRSRVRCS